MKQNPLKDRVIAEKSVGFGMAKGKMVRVRAAEWGATDGLLSSTGTKPHFAQARRELNGLTDLHPRDAMSEFAPQSERWNPVPGSDGYKVRVAPSEDGDEECLSDNERLVAGGIAEAEIERVSQLQIPPQKKAYEHARNHTSVTGQVHRTFGSTKFCDA